MRTLWLAAVFWLALAWSAPAAESFTNLLRQDFWDADGIIHAMVATNGVVYVGGEFSYLAPPGGKVAAVDAYTGEIQPEFPRVVGAAIHAILEDGQGGWFIGGEFNQVGGQPRTNLVRVRADHTVDPDFRPDPNAAVYALASDGGTLYVGGDFSGIGGRNRSWLASIALSNNVVTTWAPQPNERVACLLVTDDRLYAGGYFSSIGGSGTARLAALSRESGAALPGFNPRPDGPVLAMSLLDRRLFVAGSFDIIGGASRQSAAAVDADTGAATGWNPQVQGGNVVALVADCSTVYLGGSFTHVRGQARARVAAVDSEFGQPTAWDAGVALTRAGQKPSFVSGLVRAGDTLYVCGDFHIDGNPFHRDLVAVDVQSGRLLPWNPGLDGGISAVGVAGRTVLAGFISSPGGVERSNLAAFDARTGRVLDWDPAANGAVYALAASGGTIFAGGDFTNVHDQPRTRLAALDALTGLPRPDWYPVADGPVYALAVDGQTLIAGGSFGTLDGINRRKLGALDVGSGGVLTNWSAPVGGNSVRALALDGGTLYVGGNFTDVRAVNRSHLAALEAATGQLQPWDPGADFPVFALAVSGDAVYAGGQFDTLGGLPRARLGAVSASTGQVTGWNPGADADVNALVVEGDAIVVGGGFSQLGGQVRLGVAGVDAAGLLNDWNPGASPANRVQALAMLGEGLLVGGRPLQFAGANAPRALGLFPRLGAPVLLTSPRDQQVPVGANVRLEVAVGGLPPFTYQWRFQGLDLPGATNATLSLTNVQPANSGLYEVMVANAVGGVRAEARLLVLAPVAITGQPADFAGVATSNVVLSVAATGNPPPRYQWRLNGVNIPGAVFPVLTLTNLGPQGGGSYYVVVANSLGAVNSRIARVVFESPALAFQDAFEARGSIAGISGVGRGSNTMATSQAAAGEPRHAGKQGGRSVWLRWTAPGAGIATFDTRGSGFDTLLGIYTGNGLSNLVSVAEDEDRGGYLTSRAVFNARAGTEYAIAVDGLAGAAGDIVLSWELDASTTEFPRILAQPANQTVLPGGVAAFSVFATSPTPMTFQWYFGCLAIPGATNATLMIAGVQRRHVGLYRVVVMNASARVAESLPATLELGPQPDARSFDKLEDLLAALAPGGPGPFFRPASGGLGGDPLLVSMGSIVSQTFNTASNTTSLLEANHCGAAGGHSAWLAFKPAQDGIVHLDTLGSSFDTVLSVYRATNLITLLTNPAAAFVACDNNSAPDGIRSLLQFNGVGGAVYLAVIDGVAGSRGAATVHWQLGLPPGYLPSVSNINAHIGREVTLFANTAGILPPPTYQWLFNGTNILGATNSQLLLSMVQLEQAGLYSVILSNFAGVTTNPVANLIVTCPFTLSRSNAAFGPLGGSSNVVVVTPASCDWTVQNVPDWITLTSGAAFHGNGMLTYAVAAHTGLALRVATMRVADQSYTVAQSPEDRVPPTVAFSAPLPRARWTNPVVRLEGQAADNIGVARVEYALGGQDFTEAHGTTRWNAQAQLEPGTNLLRVRSIDVAGNTSLTHSRSVFHPVRSPLALSFDRDRGAVAGATDGQLLEIGRAYALSARAASGYVFSNWTGNLPDHSSPRLVFLMLSNRVVRANFVPNPFLPRRGSYHGLFAEDEVVSQHTAGYFTLFLTAQGTYSGHLRLGGRRYPFSGRFGLPLTTTNRVQRGTAMPLTLEMALSSGTNTAGLEGRVRGDGWTAELRAHASRFNARTRPAPYRGRYTLLVPGGESTGTTNIPGGDGFAAVSISAGGVAHLLGSLADGTAVSQSAPVSVDGGWPFHVGLYGGQGLAWSWLKFASNSPAGDLAGEWRWLKPTMSLARFHPAGFTSVVAVAGSHYRPPAGNTNRLLEFTNGLVVFSGGNLGEPFTNSITLLPGGQVTNTSLHRLTLNTMKANGLFSGSVTVPATGQSQAFRGALFQSGSQGAGYSLGTNSSGRVWLGPAP